MSLQQTCNNDKTRRELEGQCEERLVQPGHKDASVTGGYYEYEQEDQLTSQERQPESSHHSAVSLKHNTAAPSTEGYKSSKFGFFLGQDS